MLALSLCWSPLGPLVAVLFPSRNNGSLLRWCVHLVVWTSLLGGLWYLNRLGGLERVLRSPWPTLHRTWLPLLGLLVYVLGWLSRGLWLSLRREPLPNLFVDADDAWRDARIAAERENISLLESPLFLVLGSLTDDLRRLLDSLGATCTSKRVDLPFHVFTQREAVFVVCDNHGQDETLAAARLQRLCQLLAHERTANLPIQGVVLVVPFQAMPVETLVAGMRDDLRIVQKATGLDAPLYLALSGLDAPSSGQAWFQRFPALPDLDPAEIPTMFHEGIDALCQGQIASEIRDQFHTDARLPENIGVYRRLHAMQAWRTRLSQLVVEGTQSDCSEPAKLVGCYFLPAGKTESQGSALAQALWTDLLTNQGATSWTAEAIDSHAERKRRTWIGYGAGLFGACIAIAGIGWLLLPR